MPSPSPDAIVGRVRLSAAVEHLRASLWSVPAVFVVVATVAASVLNGVDVGSGSWLSGILFPGGADSARAILQTIAGSVITVTGVVFSLTVVTLQLASTQFSPRLLRTFLRDISNQVVLGTFLATFAYCLVALRGVASATADEAEMVPTAAVTGAFVLAAASVVALVFFIDHIARSIRIDSLMREVNEDTVRVIHKLSNVGEGPPVPPPTGEEVAVAAPRSGFVQAVDEEHLLRAAVAADALVRIETVIGDRVIEGAPVAWVRAPAGADSMAELEAVVRSAVQIGYERTMQQDIAFGLRQLVDVAVKALSPGVNDPTTAVHAIAHLAHLLTRLASAMPGDRCTCDADGVPRVVLSCTNFAGYLDLACDQIRRYGAGEPAVTTELLRLVKDVARVDGQGSHADALRRQAGVIVTAAEQHTAEPRDLEPLRRLQAEIEELLDRS